MMPPIIRQMATKYKIRERLLIDLESETKVKQFRDKGIE